MKKSFYLKLILIFSLLLPFLYPTLQAAGTFDNILSGKKSQDQKKGPTVITSDSMDIDMKNNVITLTGNVLVNEPSTTINADQIIVYIDKNKKAKEIVATGHVVIVQKMPEAEETKKGKRKATAGKANYNVKTGIIVLTDKPVLYQGGSYIKGHQITLWRDSDRMKVTGEESSGRMSKLVLQNNALKEHGE